MLSDSSPCLRRQTYQPRSAAAPSTDEPIAISGVVGMSIFPLSCPASVALVYAVFVAVVGDGTTLVVAGGTPEPPVVPAEFHVGVGEGIVCCVFPPGGGRPAALVLTGWTIVVGVLQGASIPVRIRIVLSVFDTVVKAPIGGVIVGTGIGVLVGNGTIGVGVGTIGVGVGTIGVGVGTIGVGVGTIGVGVGTIGVGVGTIGVGVGTIGVGVGTIGVGVDTIGVGVDTTGVLVAQPIFRLRATASCAYAFGVNKNTIPTKVNSKKTQRNIKNLCNADSRCFASFRARTCTYFWTRGWPFVFIGEDTVAYILFPHIGNCKSIEREASSQRDECTMKRASLAYASTSSIVTS